MSRKRLFSEKDTKPDAEKPKRVDVFVTLTDRMIAVVEMDFDCPGCGKHGKQIIQPRTVQKIKMGLEVTATCECGQLHSLIERRLSC